MHLAAICGDVAEVERLLISEPESVFQTDYLGRTATVILNDTLMTNLRQRANSEWVCNAERIRGMIENQQEQLLQNGLFETPAIPLYNLLQWRATPARDPSPESNPTEPRIMFYSDGVPLGSSLL
jgi:hypothetical protein